VKLERRAGQPGEAGAKKCWSTSKNGELVLSMVRDSSKSVVEFSLTVPGAFGSVWAMWSAADVAISLATGGAVKPMSDPIVQVAALGTASAMGMLSLFVNYCRSSQDEPTGAAVDMDPELGTVTVAQHVVTGGQNQHVCNGVLDRSASVEGSCQLEIKEELLSPLANAGRSPSMLFKAPEDPSACPGTLKL